MLDIPRFVSCFKLMADQYPNKYINPSIYKLYKPQDTYMLDFSSFVTGIYEIQVSYFWPPDIHFVLVLVKFLLAYIFAIDFFNDYLQTKIKPYDLNKRGKLL